MNLIQKYINGEYSGEEYEHISEKLINAKLDRDKRRSWQEQLEREYSTKRSSDKKNKRSWIIPLASAAAITLLLLTVYNWWSTAPSTDYISAVDQHISKLNIMSDQSNLRKGDYLVDELRGQANLKYINGQYNECIELLQQIHNSGETNAMDQFYLGLSYLRKKQAEPEKAVSFLLASRVNAGPQEEISWVLALAYLKSGLLPHAREELNEIIRNNSYQSGAARELLDLL